MPTIARYISEDDARRRAIEEKCSFEWLPSVTWPEYPWAVVRGQPGVDGALDKWAERLLEKPTEPSPTNSGADPATA